MTSAVRETEDKIEAEMYQLWSVAKKVMDDASKDPIAYHKFAEDLEQAGTFIASTLTAIKNTESLNVSLVGM